MSGSGGDSGYDYQAEATAFVATYAIAEQPLGWFEDEVDIPSTLDAESGGPGDDLRILTTDGRIIELQAKLGLRKGVEFWEAIVRLCNGLQTNPTLRGVLMVDSSASNPIKFDLRKELLRGGRKDNQKSIFTETRNRLSTEGISADAVLPRLRVIVKDFDVGSDGRDAARSMLRQFLEQPADIETIWRVFTDEGHKLIKHRGTRDSRSLVRLAGRHAPLKADAGGTPVIAYRYCRTLCETTKEFSVPGLGQSLPIDEAWIELRVVEDTKDRRSQKDSLEKMIREYHEWERLAEDFTIYKRWDVDTLPAFATKCVIIGGPGGGKTTLIQRLAHDLAKRDQLVLRVSLKLLKRQLEAGTAIDDSLASFLGEALGMERMIAKRVVNQLDFLLADGLDECDPGREFVAERLRVWSGGHPQCRIVVTTRPVGHHAGLFPGFDHLELLPLSDSNVRDHARRLFSLAVEDADKAASTCSLFLKGIDQDRAKGQQSVRSLAARNPLLLGFLVRLAVDEQGAVDNRAELFSKTLALMEHTPNSSAADSPALPSWTANIALDVIAFHLISNPNAELYNLRDRIAEELTRVAPGSDVARAAEQVIDYWQHRRVIEKLTAGHLCAVTFVHPTLGEFAAARHLSRLAEDEFKACFYDARRQALWHQVIVLAACIDRNNRTLRELLQLDDPLDVNSIEARIAASAVADGAGDESVRQEVASALIKRLESPIPVVAIESALSLVPIASFVSKLLANAVEPLLEHQQEWTRLGARCLRLWADPQDTDVDWFEEWFRTFEITSTGNLARFCSASSHDMPDETIEMQHRMVERGIRILIASKPSKYIEELFDDKKYTDSLSGNMVHEVASSLREAGFKSQADTITNYYSHVRDVDGMNEIRNKEMDILLEAVLEACNVQVPSTPSPNITRFVLPSMVMEGLNIGESFASDALFIRQRVDFDVMVEVIRGTIAALDLKTSDLACECAAIRKIIANSNYVPFSTLLPHIPCKPDWSRAKDIGLSPDLLERGVRHRHWSFAVTATHLLDGGAAGDHLGTIVSNLLRDGSGRALNFASYLAQEVYGSELTEKLWDRLKQGISHGCEYLVRLVILSASKERRDELLNDISQWLLHPGSRFAAGVAKHLGELNPPIDKTFEPSLRKALDYWTEQVTWCDKHQIRSKGASCPKCQYILPCAKVEVLEQLQKIGVVDSQEMMTFLTDKQTDVAKFAKKLILQIAANDTALLCKLLSKVALGELDARFLDDLSTLPTKQKLQVSSEFLRLMEPAQSVRLRANTLSQLASGWAPQEQAVKIATEFLTDAIPSIRTQAARTLRVIGATLL